VRSHLSLTTGGVLRPVLPVSRALCLFQPTRDHVSICYITRLVAPVSGRSGVAMNRKKEDGCFCYRRCSLTTKLQRTGMQIRKIRKMVCVCVCVCQGRQNVAASLLSAGFDALRHRLHIHILVCEGHSQSKIQGSTRPAMWIILHTSHSVEPLA
jgi:hypothetical protein